MRIERNQLARLLQQVTKVVNSRNTIPILDTVRLVATDGRLTATATDLDIEVTAGIDADGEIAVCLPAKTLTDIVGKAAGDKIEIDCEGAAATIKAGRSRFKLQSLPVDDFPTMEAGKFAATFTANLAAIIEPVAFAMSDEETRYYLNGVYLQPGVATATNGHRLSTNKDKAWDDHEPVILPRKLVGMMPAGEITVDVSNTKVRLTAGEIVIISRVIDGTYPDYERVVPTNNGKHIIVDADELQKAAARVAVVSDERERGVKLVIGHGEIALWVRAQGDEATDAVTCDYDGEPIEVGFNAAYLAEVLSNMPAGPVTMSLNDGGSPVLFTSKAAEGLRIVLMPRRV